MAVVSAASCAATTVAATSSACSTVVETVGGAGGVPGGNGVGDLGCGVAGRVEVGGQDFVVGVAEPRRTASVTSSTLVEDDGPPLVVGAERRNGLGGGHLDLSSGMYRGRAASTGFLHAGRPTTGRRGRRRRTSTGAARRWCRAG